MAIAESKYAFPELDGEEKLIAAVKHIVSALEYSNKNLTDEARRVLVDLGTRLSSITLLDERKGETISDIENLLDVVEEKVMRCEADRCVLWNIIGPNEAFEYLNAVDEVRKLILRLESLSLDKLEDEDKRNNLQRRARDVLQNAMVRLEEEFGYILVQSKQAFGPVHMPLHFNDVDSLDVGDDSIEGSIYKDCISRSSEEIVDLIDKDVIPGLRRIANLMFNSRCHRECTQSYINVRKGASEECLFKLKVDEKPNIEEVGRMDQSSLFSKIRRWIHAVKIFVRVFLASELRLCDQIFGELGPVALCFIKASKDSMLQLLDFGDAISVGPKTPESLFIILDMYEMLVALLPDIEALYMGVEGSSVTMKYHEVVRKLGGHVRAAYTIYKNTLASESSKTTKSGDNHPSSGHIHPLSRFVVGYIKKLADYGETLDVLFKGQDDEADHSELLSADSIQTTDGISTSSSSKLTSTGRCFVSLATLLERCLDAKSRSHKNSALRHLFLMNNIHYMTRKVKGSELRLIFGDEWIRKQNWKCQKYALYYERASWGSVLSLLQDKGIVYASSGNTWKILLKDRLRSFYLAFEEIYRTQTAWTVSDEELREDLRISISLKVILAYRTFIRRSASSLADKYTSTVLMNLRTTSWICLKNPQNHCKSMQKVTTECTKLLFF